MPATTLLYAAGIAATAARRDDLVGRLLIEPLSYDHDGNLQPIALALGPTAVLQIARAHRWIHRYLARLFERDLALGPAAYRAASERFEYVRLVQYTWMRLHKAGLAQECSRWERSERALVLALENVRKWLADRVDRGGVGQA